MNRHRRTTVLVVLSLGLSLAGCASAPWPRSKITGPTPEARMEQAREEVRKQPEGMAERKDLRITAEYSVEELLLSAERARDQGRYEEAAGLYDRVLGLAPQNERAIAGKHAIEREQHHAKMLADAAAALANKNVDGAQSILRQILIENPNDAEARKLLQTANARSGPRNEPPRLKPTIDKPVTLEFRDANIKMVFEALSRATGINFILDKDIKPDTKATVYVKQARVEDAIDMVLSTNGLQKKALSENSALVFPNTQQKLKDYQDLMIRSFYLTNASAKQVAAMLKTLLKTKDIYTDDRLNMLIIRDTPEAVHIAEKLVAANDQADPEVMLEIEVLEVSRNRLQDLGIGYPTQLAATATTLAALHNITAASVNISPSPTINFSKTTSDVNVLSNPRIRVRNNEKAKILVGDKVPIITSNVTGTAATVSESVQYIDVGLKLDVEPHIAVDDFVNIKVALEVSSLGQKTTTASGSTAYTISTRNASTLLRLKDGETQVLAGLISADERKDAKKVAGLGDIPILGRLFSDQTDTKDKTEIVLAITPHILGNISRPDAEVSEYWSGTETAISDRPQLIVPGMGGSGRGIPRTQESPPAEPTPETPVPAEPQKEPAPANPPESPGAAPSPPPRVIMDSQPSSP